MGDSVGVIVMVLVAVGVIVSVGVQLLVGVLVGVGLLVGVLVIETEGVIVCVTVGVMVGVTVGVGVNPINSILVPSSLTIVIAIDPVPMYFSPFISFPEISGFKETTSI